MICLDEQDRDACFLGSDVKRGWWEGGHEGVCGEFRRFGYGYERWGGGWDWDWGMDGWCGVGSEVKCGLVEDVGRLVGIRWVFAEERACEGRGE